MTGGVTAELVRARVQALPTLPAVVHDLISAFRDEDLNFDALARKIDIDPALTARILRVANSSFYGMSGTIATVEDAIRLIGLRTVETVVVQGAVSQQFRRPECRGFDLRQFWEHSLATAICAQELARKSGRPTSEAFTSGLIHDIGSLALASHFPQEYSVVEQNARERDVPLFEAERAVLGTDHCQAGSWIARHWHFAEPVIDAIAWHHNPGRLEEEAAASDAAGEDAAAGAERPSLADLVHNADGIAHALDLHGVGDDLVPPMQRASWERLGLTAEISLRVFRRAEAAFREMRHGLQ